MKKVLFVFGTKSSNGSVLYKVCKSHNKESYFVSSSNEIQKEWFNKNEKVELYTDSKYVKLGITEWIHKWTKNDWQTSKKENVKNKDLWVKLDDLCQKNKVIWKWVKGHSNNKYNTLADELATQAIKS